MENIFRQELKYVILKSEFYRIKKLLEAMLKSDSYGDNLGYRVRSLYFDSLLDQDLYDTLDGMMEKRKIRLRMYSLTGAMVKLEYKCKSGSDIRKYSLTISREQAKMMEDGNYEFLRIQEEAIAQKIYYRLLLGAYRPKTVIEYQRCAYVYPVSDVRVTFDTEIRTTGTPYGLFRKEICGCYIMPTDRGVLEVKYNDFLPDPIKNVMELVDRSITANSKYAQARSIL